LQPDYDDIDDQPTIKPTSRLLRPFQSSRGKDKAAKESRKGKKGTFNDQKLTYTIFNSPWGHKIITDSHHEWPLTLSYHLKYFVLFSR